MSLGEDKLCNMLLEQVSQHTGKKLPVTGYQRHLLERDYHLIKDVSSIYAVGHFELVNDGPDKPSRLRINGHTSWMMEMFLDLLLSNDPLIHQNDCVLPLFFYSQDTCKWYTLHHTLKDNFRWISVDKIPKPSGTYAGVGSREIDNVGVNAIMKL
jgi:hypothetical protein